ncbi:uncharacterized protein DMAD_11549 [Drosophila madeirensis]|uniref:Uncharacterized protein n=1 Tax=Drosophila madeirensis TaxID=30013 RepID=A0AAU9FDM7_DROMD
MDPQRATTTTEKDVKDASSPAEECLAAAETTSSVEDVSLVVQLKDATVGATETEPNLDELPSASQQGAMESQKPQSPGRLNHLIDMLDNFTIRLDVIEENVRREDQELIEPDSVTVRVDPGTAVIIQIPEMACDLGTQTAVTRPPHRQRVALKAIPPPDNQPDTRPPCERTHHTIQIRANSNPANAVPQQGPLSLGARVVRALGDFGAAFCLCLQINKDCIFCLVFFVAFVVSASFLTAFFYRTLHLTSTAARAAGDPFAGATGSYDVATIRFNGGFYYIYNRQRQHFQ